MEKQRIVLDCENYVLEWDDDSQIEIYMKTTVRDRSDDGLVSVMAQRIVELERALATAREAHRETRSDFASEREGLVRACRAEIESERARWTARIKLLENRAEVVRAVISGDEDYRFKLWAEAEECCCIGGKHDACCPGWFVNEETGLVERCDDCAKYSTDEDAAAAAGIGT